VKADPGQIEQVIMNLVVNARDAMSVGGRLTIRTRNIDIGAGSSHSHFDIPPGIYAELAISDTGCGIDAETQSHLFEPFFTTKPHGKGTGLGLSTVYGIVKQSGGDIQVSSVIGSGTTFHVLLPRTTECKPAPIKSANAHKAPSGTETILLVEDDEGVRMLLVRLLEAYGYTVLAACQAAEAFSLLENCSSSIQMLVTDLIMPQMNGRELAERVLEKCPDMKVLFISGYTDDCIIHRGVLDQRLPFLQKPFAPETFLSKVRAVLDACAAGSLTTPVSPKRRACPAASAL
jgi:two-component system, cell cycle sensor histidine kinase and response regulator CckA